MSTGPVLNDLGQNAWETSSLTTTSQYSYVSGAFTPAEKATIAANGFSLSFVERVLQGPSASVYTAATPIVLSSVGIDTGVRRYQVFLGLDASGDTVVVLPTTISASGAGGRIIAPGTSYTLTSQGNGYHSYRFDVDPVTQQGSLYIDGSLRMSAYGGYNTLLSDTGLSFSGFSGGTARFSSVALALAVPEPASFALMAAGLLLVGATAGRSSRAASTSTQPTMPSRA